MKPHVIVPILCAAGAAPAAAEPFVCKMSALTPAERTRHMELTEKLLDAATGRTELPDGYAFDLDVAGIPLPEVAEWIGNESRCCPFLDFGLEVRRGGATRLRLTGAPGVKEFLAAELGLGGDPAGS